MGRSEEQRWRRWLLGGRYSWRRVVLAGIGGGVALAIAAALIAGLFGGGSGSLDESEPTAIVPAPGIADADPGDVAPTVEEPTEPEPTMTPVDVEPSPTEPPPEPTPTAPLAEPSPTPVPEEPTLVPTVTDDLQP